MIQVAQKVFAIITTGCLCKHVPLMFLFALLLSLYMAGSLLARTDNVPLAMR
jgi:hypothetical protein